MDKPFISIVVPTVSGNSYLLNRALKSIYLQEIDKKIQVLIIEDGTRDKSIRRNINKWKSKIDIRYFQNTVKIGAMNIRKRCISKCEREVSIS